MKKILYWLNAALLVGAMAFVSCSDDNNDNNNSGGADTSAGELESFHGKPATIDPNAGNKLTGVWKYENIEIHQGQKPSDATTEISTVNASQIK